MESLPIREAELSQLTNSLRKLDFFRALSIQELDEILRYMKLYAYKSGDFIFRKGEPGDSLCVINDGKAKAFTKAGFFSKENVLGYLNPGEVFGEMSLLDGRRRSASVKTLMPTKVFVLLRSSFDTVIDGNPTFREKLEKIVEKRRKENS